jgi:5'(3')-deoxyribonucleotidase
MPNWTVFLDMDEVLCDFTGGAARLFGVPRAELDQNRALGVWSIVEPLHTTLGGFGRMVCSAGEDFWANLQPTPWANEIVDLVSFFTEDWWILTQPFADCVECCCKGKQRWLNQFFGEGFPRCRMQGNKHLLARENAVLIDDKEETVLQFRQFGGKSILFPSLGGSLYSLAKNPVAYVANQLALLEKEDAFQVS